MAKVRNLPSKTVPADTDLLYLVDSAAGPNGGRKLTIADLKAGTNPSAGEVSYNPATSSLTSTDVQDAIDDVDAKIQSHGTRHSPDNADGLAVGTPVDVGTVNAEGVANSYSRSDHVHDHGTQTDGTLHAAATTSVNGFMSSTDKTKVDTLNTGFLQYQNAAIYTNATTSFTTIPLGTDVESFSNNLFTKVNSTDFRADFTGYVRVTYTVTAFTDTNDRGAEITVVKNGGQLNQTKTRTVGKNLVERTVSVSCNKIVSCTNGDIFTLAARTTEAGPITTINAGSAVMTLEVYRIG